MVALLTRAGYRARRLPRNLGHNQNRLAFEAVPDSQPARSAAQ
jgi:hypothetical protein